MAETLWATKPAIAVTIAGVDCYDEGLKESYSRGGDSTAERVIRCAWDDRGAILDYFFLPLNAIPYDYDPYLVMMEASIDGEGLMRVETIDGNEIIAYAQAVITLKYQNAKIDPTETGSESIEYAGEIFTFPEDMPLFSYIEDSGGEPGDDAYDVPTQLNPSIPIATACFTRTMLNQSTLPTALILACLNKVNSESFFGADAETVFCAGASSTRKFIRGALKKWDLTYKFNWNPIGWNKLYNPATHTFETVYRKGTSTKLFASTDLTVLLDGASYLPEHWKEGKMTPRMIEAMKPVPVPVFANRKVKPAIKPGNN